MNITFPKLTAYQQDVFDYMQDSQGTGKIAVIKSVRQSGKSFFCMVLLIALSLRHSGKSVYIAPTLDQSRNCFNGITNALRNTAVIKSCNGSTLTITFNNGSEISFKSTAQKNSLRGFTVSNLLVLDECAYLPDDDVFNVLPFVNANNAPILICSTPFTRTGYFYNMYMAGLEGDGKVRTFDWSKYGEISRFLTPDRKAFYMQTMSRSKYTTEVEGEFLSDEGLLFQNIQACIRDDARYTAYCYIGIDFATGAGGDSDYTVMSIMNDRAEQVALYRNHNLSPMQQVDWLAGLINDISTKTTVRKILAEKNSIGAVYIDALNSRFTQGGLRITDWTTTNESKQELVTNLQIGLENEYIHILNNDVLLDELRKYQAEINPNTKKISYNGKGGHDDTVIALMLSYKAIKQNLGTYSISVFTPKKQKTLQQKYN